MERKLTQNIDRYLESISQQISAIKLQPQNTRKQRNKIIYPESPYKLGIIKSHGTSGGLNQKKRHVSGSGHITIDDDSDNEQGWQQQQQQQQDESDDDVFFEKELHFFDTGSHKNPKSPKSAKSPVSGGFEKPKVGGGSTALSSNNQERGNGDNNSASQNVENGWKLSEIMASELSESSSFKAILDRWASGQLDAQTKLVVIMSLFVLGQRKLQLQTSSSFSLSVKSEDKMDVEGGGGGSSEASSNMERLKELLKNEANLQHSSDVKKTEWVRIIGSLAMDLEKTGKLGDFHEFTSNSADALALDQLVDHIGQLATAGSHLLQFTPRLLVYTSRSVRRLLLEGVYHSRRHIITNSNNSNSNSNNNTSDPKLAEREACDRLLPTKPATLRIRKNHRLDHKARMDQLEKIAKESSGGPGAIDTAAASGAKGHSLLRSPTLARRPSGHGQMPSITPTSAPALPFARSGSSATALGLRSSRPSGMRPSASAGSSLMVKTRRPGALRTKPISLSPAGEPGSPTSGDGGARKTNKPANDGRIMFVDFNEGANVIQDIEREKREKQQKEAEEREYKKQKKKLEAEKRRLELAAAKQEEKERKQAEKEERKRKKQEELERKQQASGVKNKPTRSRGRPSGSTKKNGSGAGSFCEEDEDSNGDYLPTDSENDQDDDHHSVKKDIVAVNDSDEDSQPDNPINKRRRVSSSSGKNSGSPTVTEEAAAAAAVQNKPDPQAVVSYKDILPEYPDLPPNTDVEQIFKDSNALTYADSHIILNFLSGRDVEAHRNDQKPVRDIVLNRVTRPDPTNDSKVLIEQIIFQVNYSTGEWRKLKRTAKRTATSLKP
ncbi:hypothetical protein H4219_003740 [Mycoemilia scoparia]|uniref:Uncharacterized protein n=1 Tax=Mycoemilia scoparia TaxID=417184 RepID=A0A9W8A1X7_9FUNG|nr:hypothetical protein H4219_003740 [Mycoemilia scoparia]